MRGSTALFLAGAAMIASGTVAPAFSAEEPSGSAQAPAADAESAPAPEAATAAPVEAPPAEPVEDSAAEPVEDAAAGAEPQGGLERPTLEPAIERLARDRERAGDRRAEKGRSGDAKQPLADASVTIKNFQFSPKTLTIAPGDRVTWTNRDSAEHNAVDRGEFETDLLDKGDSDSVTIGSAGTYDYVCTIHPDMKGKLVVQGGGSGDPSRSSGSGSGGSGGTSGSSSSGSSSGGSTSASPTGSSGGGGSSGSLPSTGQEQLPLLILGTGLIVAGLLTRAFDEYRVWR